MGDSIFLYLGLDVHKLIISNMCIRDYIQLSQASKKMYHYLHFRSTLFKMVCNRERQEEFKNKKESLIVICMYSF